MKRFSLYIITLLFVFVGFSCSDDNDEKNSLTLRFSYTADPDAFLSEVDKVNVYVFNSEGCFVEEYCVQTGDLQKGKNSFDINLDPGTYDFVVWGNLTDYYSVCSLQKGITSFKDCHLSFKNDGKLLRAHPTPLYYGASYQVDVPVSKAITLNMKKNTRSVRLTIKGCRGVDNSTYTCVLTSINAGFTFDNSVVKTKTLEYNPELYRTKENELAVDFVFMDALRDSHLKLSRNNQDGKVDELFDAPLVELLFPATIPGDLDPSGDIEITLFIDESLK